MAQAHFLFPIMLFDILINKVSEFYPIGCLEVLVVVEALETKKVVLTKLGNAEEGNCLGIGGSDPLMVAYKFPHN